MWKLRLQSKLSKKWTTIWGLIGALLACQLLVCPMALAQKKVRFAHLKLSDLRFLPPTNYLVWSHIERNPSSFINEELILDPPPSRNWADSLFMEDSDGVLNNMRVTVKEWQDKQEYNQNWNLEGTNVVPVPADQAQEAFLKKRAMNYFDRRVSGEVKNPRPGTSWATVARVNRTLKPASQLELAPQFKLKFKARVLQGRASVNIENPLVEANIEGRVNGQANAQLAKTITPLGLRAQVEYRLKQKEMVTVINKKITNSVSAQASSIERSSASVGVKSDQRVEINFGQAF